MYKAEASIGVSRDMDGVKEGLVLCSCPPVCVSRLHDELRGERICGDVGSVHLAGSFCCTALQRLNPKKP